MPIRRRSLSRAERGRYRSDAERLCAFGLDVEIPEELREDSRALELHIAPPYINIIRQLPSGLVTYAILVRLVALRPNVILEESQLASGWDQDLFQISANKKGLYYLRQGFNFTRAEVLNHLIEERHCFHHRGDSVEGWLLASGLKPIPDAYRNSTPVPVHVSFTDQFGVDCVSQAYALMERSAHYKAPILRKENSAGLYATNLRSASIGENKESTPAPRTRDNGPAGAPAVSRLREEAPAEDFGTPLPCEASTGSSTADGGARPASDAEESREWTSRSESSSDPGGLAARDYYKTTDKYRLSSG